MKDRILTLLLVSILCITMPASALYADDGNSFAGDFEQADGNSDINEANPFEEIETIQPNQEVIIEDEEILAEDEDSFVTGEPAMAMADYVPGPGEASPTWGADLMNLTQTKIEVETALREGRIEEREIVVAVIDSGIYTDHELFTDETSQDRIHPASCSFLTKDKRITDENGHGTHVAGIIAANTPSNVKLMILKVLNKDNEGTIDDMVNAINYAVRNGADIINLSLGTTRAKWESEDQYQNIIGEISAAIKSAEDAEIPVIVAAGNEGCDIDEIGAYPAGLDDIGIITVSAIDSNGTLYEKSNYGASVDFCAPGVDIYGAGLQGTDSYEYFSGTSLAASFLSAAVSMAKICDPEMTVDETKHVLCKLTSDTEDKMLFGNGMPTLDYDYLSSPYRLVITSCTQKEGELVSIICWNALEGVKYNIYRQTAESHGWGGPYELLDTVTGGVYYDSSISRHNYFYYIEATESGCYKMGDQSEEVFLTVYVPTTRLMLMAVRKNDNEAIELINGETVGEHGQLYVKQGDVIQLLPVIQDGVDVSTTKWRLSDDQEYGYYSGDHSLPTISLYSDGSFTANHEGVAVIYVECTVPSKGILTAFLSVTVYRDFGESLLWNVNTEGEDVVLTISGTGDMNNFREGQILPWSNVKDQITKIVIEDEVTTIGQHAFENMKHLTSVEGMAGVRVIGANAFSKCYSLENIEFGESLTCIEEYAFQACHKLLIPGFPEGLKIIERDAFEYCARTREIHIPEGIEEIRIGAFYGIPLDTLTIPDTITDLSSFPGLNSYTCSVKEYKVSEQHTVFTTKDGVLFNKDMTRLISYPALNNRQNYEVPNCVRTIDYAAFRESKLREVVLPEGLTIIPECCFMYCYVLERVEIPASVMIIDYSSFWCCYNLNTVIIHENSCLEIIRGGAFRECRKLESFELPEKVQYIEHNTFMDTPLQRLVIPRDFRGICSDIFFDPDMYIFYNSGSDKNEFSFLTEIIYHGFSSEYNDIQFLDADIDAFYNANLFFSVTGSCGENIIWTAEGVSGNLTLTISGTGVMDDYSATSMPWYEGRDEITKIVIEDGVTYIGAYAFYELDHVREIDIPSSIEGYGISAFAGITNMDSFTYVQGEETLRVQLEYYAAVYQEINGAAYAYQPEVIVSTINGEQLKEGRDYTVRYKNTAKPGNGHVAVSFLTGEAAGSVLTLPFTVYQNSIEGQAGGLGFGRLSVRLTKTKYEYNGLKQKAQFTVKVSGGSRLLKEGVDYKVTGRTYATNAGTYYLTISGLGGYHSQREVLSFTILPKSIRNAVVSISGSAKKPYTGSAIRPSVTVRLGGKTISSAYYTVAYKNNTNRGQATITVTGKGNYTDSVRTNFTIVRAPVAQASIKGIVSKNHYTGKPITQKPTVKISGKILKNGTDYTLSYKNNINVGTAKVIITGKGNYSGTKSLTFSIFPKAVKNVTLNSKKGKLTVKWAKSNQVSGYQLQYSTSSSFPGSKTKSVTISSASTVSRVLTGLASGKSWYVRVRAYRMSGGSRFWSDWSTVKKAKM